MSAGGVKGFFLVIVIVKLGVVRGAQMDPNIERINNIAGFGITWI